MVSVLAVLAAAGVASAATCAPKPVAVPVGNVTLAKGIVARGIEIGIGTPAQPFAFMPGLPANNTLVYGTDGHCTSDKTPLYCRTRRGGSYNTAKSSTSAAPAGGSYSVDASPWYAAAFVADTLALGLAANATALAAFPVGIPVDDLGQQDYHPMATIGLGPGSVLLKTLRTANAIASRTWSFFYGLDGSQAASQADGVFVLGGYDAAKVVAATRHPYALAPTAQCPSGMLVTISDLELNLANGTDVSLFPDTLSTALQACIMPDYPALMTLPTDPFFNNFEAYGNTSVGNRSFGINFFTNRYNASADDVYTGGLSITLQSGLKVAASNDQLVLPDRTIDAGGVIVANATGPDTTLLSIQDVNAGDLMQLGRHFLSLVYLMVNQDAAEFVLWQANATAAQRLVAVDEKNVDVTDFCSTTAANATAAATIPPAVTPTVTPAPAAETETPSALATGTIVGMAVGAAAGVALVAAAAVFFLRRRRRAAAGAVAAPVPLSYDTTGSSLGMFEKSTLDTDTFRGYRQELPVLEPVPLHQPRRYHEMQG